MQLLVQPGRPRGDQPQFAKNARHGAEAADYKLRRQDLFQQGDRFTTYRRLPLRLEHVEQGVDRSLPDVAVVFLVQFAPDQPDFRFIEEIRRRVEFIKIDDAVAAAARIRRPRWRATPRRDFLARVDAATSAVRGAEIARRAVLDELDAVAKHLDEGVRNQHELLLPQQRQQVVGRVRRQHPRLIDHPQEADDLLRFDAGDERESPQSILVQLPRQSFGLVRLPEDRGLLPGDLLFLNVEHQSPGHVPDRCKGFGDLLERALVDRVVRQVHLQRALSLGEHPQEFFHGADIGRRRRDARARSHDGVPIVAATCATSLSPRPLRQRRTA